MAFGLPLSVAPMIGILVLLSIASVFTRVWMNDMKLRALRDLQALGVRPGRTFKLGGAWALRAVRDPANLLWALLAASAWIAVVISLRAAK